jgi:hypothetical protein
LTQEDVKACHLVDSRLKRIIAAVLSLPFVDGIAQDSKSAAIDAFCIEARGGEELLYAQAQFGFSTENLRVKIRDCEDLSISTDKSNARGKGYAQAIHRRSSFYSDLLMKADRGRNEVDGVLLRRPDLVANCNVHVQ